MSMISLVEQAPLRSFALGKRIEGVDAAIRRSTALGGQLVSRIDLEYPVCQMVEMAVRAL